MKKEDIEDIERVLFFFRVVYSFSTFFGAQGGRGEEGERISAVPPKEGREFWRRLVGRDV